MINSKDIISCDFDDDAFKMLDICLVFLEQYFDHSSEGSRGLMRKVFIEHPSAFDEDLIHHEMPYRFSAFVHYLGCVRDESTDLNDWLRESGHFTPPAEAISYFRDNYYER